MTKRIDRPVLADVDPVRGDGAGHASGRKCTGIVLLLVGAVAGLLSGLFGIGGGAVIVPALVWIGLSQRHASATSLASMIPTSIAGMLTYALQGNVDWLSALLMAVGAVAGAQLGTRLLKILPEIVLRWTYAGFMICIVIQQLTFTPQRHSTIHISVGSAFAIIILGICMGTLSGMLGVGGGAIATPGLSMLGASDLIARGTSLLTILPSTLSGTITNLKNHMLHLRNGLFLGLVAAATAPMGTWLAGLLSPRSNSNLMALYLCLIVVRSVYSALTITPIFQRHTRHKRTNRSHDGTTGL